MTGSFVSWIKEGRRSPLARGALATRPQSLQFAVQPSPRRAVLFDPNRFAHLRPAPVVTAPAIPASRPSAPDAANTFAQQVIAADASARGRKFDRSAFVDTPPPPPDRHVTAQDIARAVRKVTGE